jgi:hypothetical protein
MSGNCQNAVIFLTGMEFTLDKNSRAGDDSGCARPQCLTSLFFDPKLTVL